MGNHQHIPETAEQCGSVPDADTFCQGNILLCDNADISGHKKCEPAEIRPAGYMDVYRNRSGQSDIFLPVLLQDHNRGRCIHSGDTALHITDLRAVLFIYIFS